MATGRTSPRFSKFQIEDSGGTLRDIPISTFGGVGLTYDEVDVSAIQEVVKNFLTGQANFSLYRLVSLSCLILYRKIGRIKGRHNQPVPNCRVPA